MPVVQEAPQIKETMRNTWRQVRIERAREHLLVEIIFMQIIIVIIAISMISVFLLLDMPFVFGFLLVIFLLADAIYMVSRVLHWNSIVYGLDSGSFRDVNGLVDVKPGHVYIRTGFLYHTEVIVNALDMAYVVLQQDLFARIFKYGSLVIKDNRNTTLAHLVGIKTPREYMMGIQGIIDQANGDNLVNPSSSGSDGGSRPPPVAAAYYGEPNDMRDTSRGIGLHTGSGRLRKRR